MSFFCRASLCILLSFLLTSCYTNVGAIPERNPDVVDKYREGSFDLTNLLLGNKLAEAPEKRGILEFVNQLCTDAGFTKGQEAYQISSGSEGSSTAILGVTLSSEKYKTVKVWCKR